MDGVRRNGKINLLDLLGIVGGEKALSGVVVAARSGDDAAQDAATRVLGGWMSPTPLPVLLELDKAGPEKFRIRCLRGFIRIPRQLDVSLQGRIAMCRDAMLPRLAMRRRPWSWKYSVGIHHRRPWPKWPRILTMKPCTRPRRLRR